MSCMEISDSEGLSDWDENGCVRLGILLNRTQQLALRFQCPCQQLLEGVTQIVDLVEVLSINGYVVSTQNIECFLQQTRISRIS